MSTVSSEPRFIDASLGDPSSVGLMISLLSLLTISLIITAVISINYLSNNFDRENI